MTITRSPQGRYRVRLSIKGQKFDEYFDTKKAASLAEASARIQMGRGSFIPAELSAMPFSSFIKEFYWADREAKEIKASSIERETPVVARMEAVWGKRPLSSITRADIQKWMDKSKNAPATKTRERNICHRVFQVAIESDLLFKNPCKGIRMPSGDDSDDQTQPRVYPTLKEALAIHEHMEDRFKAMVSVMILSGARLGEAAALKRRDICMEDSTISIKRTVFVPASGLPYLTACKTKKSRGVVEIPASLKRELAAHCLKFKVGDDDLLFPGATGEVLRLGNFRTRAWARACEGAQVNHNPHSLRHLYCSLLISQGCTVEKVAMMARHASPATTYRIYVHELRRAAGEASPAVAALESLMTGTK